MYANSWASDGKKELWCVWVIGPDSLIAQPSFEIALERSLKWFRAIESDRLGYDRPGLPVIYPVPKLWTGSAEGHAEELTKHGGEPEDIC